MIRHKVKGENHWHVACMQKCCSFDTREQINTYIRSKTGGTTTCLFPVFSWLSICMPSSMDVADTTCLLEGYSSGKCFFFDNILSCISTSTRSLPFLAGFLVLLLRKNIYNSQCNMPCKVFFASFQVNSDGNGMLGELCFLSNMFLTVCGKYFCLCHAEEMYHILYS